MYTALKVEFQNNFEDQFLELVELKNLSRQFHCIIVARHCL